MTGYENLTKVLKNHLAHCKMHEFSLQKDRHCTCGVEKAREELATMTSMKRDLATILLPAFYGEERISKLADEIAERYWDTWEEVMKTEAE